MGAINLKNKNQAINPSRLYFAFNGYNLQFAIMSNLADIEN